jgi:hypothetical protein
MRAAQIPRRWYGWAITLLLTGVVLGTALVPVLAAEPVAKQVMPRTLESVTVLPAAFSPNSDNMDYTNSGQVLEAVTGFNGFTAQVFFPHPVVTLRKLTLMAYDSGPGSICLDLRRLEPFGNLDNLAQACSVGNSGTDTIEVATVVPRRALMRHGVYLYLSLPSPAAQGETYKVYGARILYSY